MEQRDAAVMVASRDDASFRTFPHGQQETERHFNELVSFFLGLAGDTLYGPLVLNSRLSAPYCRELTPDMGWGWRPYVLARCVLAGHGIAFHSGAFECPADQRGEDDSATRAYRLQQLAQNIIGLRAGLSVVK